MISRSGFYVPLTRHERRIERNITLLHFLSGAALGVFIAVVLFFNL